jgi:hypothetical protein
VDNDNEEWRPVVDHPDYDVSSLGRVRSWKRKGSRALNTPHIMKPHVHPLGYIRLVIDGAQSSVHQLVAAAWHGPCPPGMEVDHINNIRGDNRAENLRYLTRRQNMQRIAYELATECLRGHPLSGKNLYVRPGGARACRECSRQSLANLRKFGRGNPCSIDSCERMASNGIRGDNPICEMHYQRQRREIRRTA